MSGGASLIRVDFPMPSKLIIKSCREAIRGFRKAANIHLRFMAERISLPFDRNQHPNCPSGLEINLTDIVRSKADQ